MVNCMDYDHHNLNILHYVSKMNNRTIGTPVLKLSAVDDKIKIFCTGHRHNSIIII